MDSSAIQLHHWTNREYYQMAASGIINPDERIELINGNIVDMSPQTSFHSTAIRLAEEALRLVFPSGYDIRVQMPLALAYDSEPEPDISVVQGTPRDFIKAHPDTAVLIVEVSDSSLLFDRDQKKKLYARFGIPEYWIINLKDNCLEVYQEPVNETYKKIKILHHPDKISPAYSLLSSISVSEILP